MIDQENIKPEEKLTEKQKKFCAEYLYDWNATRAAKVAGYSEDTAYSIGWENLRKPEIIEYIEHLKKNLAEVAGVSPLMVLKEHMKLAFSSVAHLHNTWIEKKEFDTLTEDQKSCIQEISSQIRTVFEYDPDSQEKKPREIEFVKVKLYDKQKSLDSINKMLGYDAPIKTDLMSGGEKLTFDITIKKSDA